MSNKHFEFWPKGLPHTVLLPVTTLGHNLEFSAARYPDKPALVFYDRPLSYSRLRAEATRLAGYLRRELGVARGDRVLLSGQNCPQFVVAFYAILRAGAIVVPVNVMNTAEEFAYMVEDSGATVAIVADELYPRLEALLDSQRLRRAVLFSYADYIDPATDLEVPEWVRASHPRPGKGEVTDWKTALTADFDPGPLEGDGRDLAVLPYTSGTTGKPKGCMLSHRNFIAAATGSQLWRGLNAEVVILAVAPMFHLLGMQYGVIVPVLTGGTAVLLPRWDRDAALVLIERYRVNAWGAAPPVIVDFFANPAVEHHDLSSLALVFGGAAAMPEAVSAMLKDKYGVIFNESYGLTETAAFLHANPVHRPKRQCLGVPTFGVDSRVVDAVTGKELGLGEVGELVTSGEQVMSGYWNNPEANRDAFIEIDGKRFLRTGDLAHVDEEGYFFMRDRLKRMINASGYKVWPAEVENALYGHPDIQEACVVGVPDARRGETVKALVVLKPGREADAEAIIAWAREHMAVYKAPRIVEFVPELPKSNVGKILWRQIQEKERQIAETGH